MKTATLPSFGRLQATRAIGHGAMGEVFEARDTTNGDRFVVKRLRAQTRSYVDVGRFRREAEVMRRLNHPNIMPVLHVATTAETPYFVMPYREGKPLTAKLAEGRVSYPLACRIARDLCSALAEVHRLCVLHRDVKPANIFIEASGRVVLLDFGLAKILRSVDSLTAAGAILGSPAYMAPEQIRGETVDARADVYSLGVVLFEMLTGENPFAANDDIVECLRRQLHETPRRVDALVPGRISEEVGELIHRMLNKDAACRPASETCFEKFAGIVRAQERDLRAPTRASVRPAFART